MDRISLASASMDGISQANEHNPQEDGAAAGLAISMNESSDENKHNPQEEDGAAALASASMNGSYNPQEDAAAEPALTSMDQSSDVNTHTPQEEDVAADLTSASMVKSSDAIKNADVVAKGIASVLGPVMNDFDSGVEGAFKSQSILASSIDRLTRELDKLLEDVPLPFATQHATRLSGIRRRVLTLNTSLRIIQRRLETIERFLAGYASKAISKDNQQKASFFSTENSYSTSRGLSLLEVPSIKAMPSSRVEDHKNDDGWLSKVRGTNISDQYGNIQSAGSHDSNVQEESVSKSLHIEISNQEPNGLQGIITDKEAGGLNVLRN